MNEKAEFSFLLTGVELTRFVRALLTADRPVTATALDEGGSGGDLLVAAQTHRNCQLLRPHHHRALVKDELPLLYVPGGPQEPAQHVISLDLKSNV